MSATAELTWKAQTVESDFRCLFKHTPLVFVQCRAGGEIVAVNPVLGKGLTNCLKAAERFTDLLPADQRAAGERALDELFEGKRNSLQLIASNPSGIPSAAKWTGCPIYGPDGNVEYALMLGEEIDGSRYFTALHRRGQRLEAIGRLAGGLAHDFNSLLTGVLLECDLLMQALEPGHRGHTYAEEIRSDAMQAAGLVRRLLSATRPISEVRVISLNEVAEGLQSLLERLAGERIELRFQLDPKLGLVKIDRTEGQQILLNLVLNARDAMPHGGRITVETSNCRIQLLAPTGATARKEVLLPCALLVVGDEGEGMDEGTRAHLFEAFFTTKGGKGTGLGLATVDHIVTSNGGLIHVDSTPCCGTRISVLLPLADGQHQASRDLQPPTKNLPSFNKKETMP